MNWYKFLLVGLFFLVLFSCTDDWYENRTEKSLIKHEWVLHMYVDGLNNEIVSIGDMTYVFEEDGTFIKTIEGGVQHQSTWEIPERDYLRIGSATFRLKTLTNKILSIEYGEDVLYFIPYD
jgi:hypothetical protein